MAKIIPIGEPANDSERKAIAYLREHLSDAYTVLHNFELKAGDKWFEIDLAIIAPHSVYVVDVKSTLGEIHVDGNKWQPEGRTPFTSPLPKLRSHAKVLKSLIVGTPEHPERRKIYVDAAVILTAPGAFLNDPSGRETPSVCQLQGCESFFQDSSRLPFQPPTSTVPHEGAIRQAIQGKARARTGLPTFGNWKCEERLGGSDNFTEYRAYNSFAGPVAGHVFLRAYKADPYLPAEERAAQAKRIGNAFRAPDKPAWLLDFEHRGKYDREILKKLHSELPSEPSGADVAERLKQHRQYVAMMRRLHFFECRDQSWKNLLPYRAADKMLRLIHGQENLKVACSHVIRAITRGEGLFDPNRLKGKLALQVRQVDDGTIRSYRVFAGERFSLQANTKVANSPYLEHAPTGLVLHYDSQTGGNGATAITADLAIGLDVLEMLERLNQGYRPTVEEVQGYYLSLSIFKNILLAAPYQEILLTTTGHEFYAVQRQEEGKLEMFLAEAPPEYGTPKAR